MNNGYTWNDGNRTFQSQQMTYPFSNVAYVTSLEEALIRTTQFNSDMIYFNQDRNEFYRVRVDTNGRKSYLTFVYSLPEQMTQTNNDANYASLVARIEALEKLIKKEGTDNGQLDG